MSDSPEPTKPRRRTATKAAAPAKTTKATKPAAKKTAAKPAAKTASKTATTSKSGTKTTRATTRTRKTAASPVSPEARYRMIAEAAYLIAESHGFDSSRTLNDWLEAEGQIDRVLSGTTRH